MARCLEGQILGGKVNSELRASCFPLMHLLPQLDHGFNNDQNAVFLSPRCILV